jgi:hypothetical protein
LLAESAIAGGAGHPVHKGTPREDFIAGFLKDHKSERISIGRGEIIDATSTVGEKRPNIDIVAFKSDYPRLLISPNIGTYLAESVIATIEVKSTLTAEELEHAMTTAVWVKARARSIVQVMQSGYQPPGILCFVVAYDGPVQMQTVHSWIDPIHKKLGVADTVLGPTWASRVATSAPSIDGIFVLGKGFVHFDNAPISWITDAHRQSLPAAKWVVGDVSDMSLFLFFLWLTEAASGVSAAFLNAQPYLANTTLTLHFKS